MPRLTLKNTNVGNGAPTSVNLDKPARKIRRDSACPRLTLHLNAKQRKEAEAAARSLRQAVATLESYRRYLNGRAATESEITQPLLDSAWAAINTFNRIAHPGGRAREIFGLAMRAFNKTSELLSNDIQRELDCEVWRQAVAEAVCGVL